jgi:hypothetical protein
MVVWRGLSVIDGRTPLVVLATFDTRRDSDSSSANAKTGGMVQTFILRDDVDPLTALRDGLDASICGVCPHKSIAAGGSGACYVNVGQAPLSTWRAYKRDGTRTDKRGRPTTVGDSVPLDLDMLRGRRIRFGAYGDPAAVPFEVWQSLAAVADGVTGYTHQWRAADPRFAQFCMASADSAAEGVIARHRGYRNFIVRAAGDPKPRGAVVCPASAEAGKRTVCASCMQCGGTSNGRTADITIVAHGSTARKFRPLPLTVV